MLVNRIFFCKNNDFCLDNTYFKVKKILHNTLLKKSKRFLFCFQRNVLSLQSENEPLHIVLLPKQAIITIKKHILK